MYIQLYYKFNPKTFLAIANGASIVKNLNHFDNMEQKFDSKQWKKYAEEYDPIKIGSIDGTDAKPHDKAIVKAIKSIYQLPPKRYLGDPKSTIFIGRLHPKFTETNLITYFKKFGPVENCRVVKDNITGISKCYGFIEYKHRSSCREAVLEMNNKFLDNCQILVDYECARLLNGWKPRRLGGGFGGKKESGQLRFGCIDRPFQRPLSSTVDLREVFRKEKQKKLQ